MLIIPTTTPVEGSGSTAFSKPTLFPPPESPIPLIDSSREEPRTTTPNLLVEGEGRGVSPAIVNPEKASDSRTGNSVEMFNEDTDPDKGAEALVNVHENRE